MHIKRNLSIAALAALIGIPALGATNANAARTYNYGGVQRTQQGEAEHNAWVQGQVNNEKNQELNNNSAQYVKRNQRAGNNSNQYSANSLPQTGEVSHQASALAASIVLGSIGVGAAVMDKKHNQLD